MRVLVRSFRSRKTHPNWTGIVKEIEQTLDETVKPELLEYFERITKEWANKPEFAARKKIGQDAISVYVYPTGENAKIWAYVTLGTRPHKIRPKSPMRSGGRASVLAFPAVYKPRTSPGGHYKGSGESSGPTIFAAEVDHPGSKPREFEKHIARWYGPKFRQHMENAIRRGARRA